MGMTLAAKPKRGRPKGSTKRFVGTPLTRVSNPPTATQRGGYPILVHKTGLLFKRIGENTLQGVNSGQIYENVSDESIAAMPLYNPKGEEKTSIPITDDWDEEIEDDIEEEEEEE